MLTDTVVNEIIMDVTDDEESSVPIIECILKGKTFDLEISEEIDIKLTIVRKVLYKLYDAGIVTYTKTRDPEKANQYLYSWQFEQQKVFDIINRKNEKLLEEIEKSIAYEEENMFFACQANGHRYEFEKASENNFECPQCGESLDFQDNSTIIVELLKEKAAYLAMGKSRGK
jgi:transcription initiation factor TFIIE subunit alpha